MSEVINGAEACEWGQYCFDDTDMSLWHTTCGDGFALNDGDPKENGMNYCCYCGRPITVHHYVDEDEDVDD